MSNTTDRVTLTEWQMNLLSSIFRLIAKEITCDEDKQALAPGEIGISYTEGTFYVKDPHTGELFTPNSLGHVRQILSKYDPVTNKLNADYVNGIRYYSDVSQLTPIGTTLSADSVIRQMEYPGFLMSNIEHDDYQSYGFPAKNGVMIVYKISPQAVFTTFYDNYAMCNYTGRYNPFKQLLEGWYTNEGSGALLETVGGGDRTKIYRTAPLQDMDILTVRVTETLNAGAKVSFNNNEYLPIVNENYEPLSSAITANSIIMLIYDSKNKVFIKGSSAESTVLIIMEVMQKRIDKVTSDLNLAIADYKERIRVLSESVDTKVAALKSRPGVISTVISELIVSVDNLDTINAVQGFDPALDKLVINFNQTLLRPTIDYIIQTSGSIVFPEIRFNKGDKIQFIVLKQADPSSL